MTKETDIWVRVAGNAKRVKSGTDPFHWRCYVRREDPETPIRSFRLGGAASDANVIPGTDPTASNPLGLTAWIDFYGDVTVEDDIATITLKQP